MQHVLRELLDFEEVGRDVQDTDIEKWVVKAEETYIFFMAL